MFKVSEKFVRTLKLGDAASQFVSSPFIDMPELIVERALKGSEKTLSEHAATTAISGYSPVVEVIPNTQRQRLRSPASCDTFRVFSGFIRIDYPETCCWTSGANKKTRL